MALLGKEVRSNHELNDLPFGTPGRIVQVQLAGRNGFQVAVRWQCESPTGQYQFTKAEFERFLALADTAGKKA